MKTHSPQCVVRSVLFASACAVGAVLVSACTAPSGGVPVAEEALPEVVQQALAPALPGYNVNATDTSVSGLSSGGFFAGQMGVAFSSTIKGVGIVAGGTYDCAGQTSYFSCIYQSSPNVTTSISNTRSWSGSTIDATSNMANQRIYMFSGRSDTTVATSVMDQVYNYYVTTGGFVPAGNVLYKKDLNTAHTFPTDFNSTGNNACTTAASPYISNCSFDGAGAILQHVYGPLAARNNGTLGGSFLQFNQSEFISTPNSYGMDTTGWLYVPAACASGAACKLHIAFHGCQQNYATIGDRFVRNTGYARWADTNNIIVLFPQTVVDNVNHNPSPSQAGANINGCWDWVGYYGTDFDRRSGRQMAAVKRMIDRVASGYTGGGGGPPTIPAAPTGLTVTGTTSSTVSLSWTASTGATSYDVYRNGSKVNPSAVTSTSYTDGGLSANTSYNYTVRAVNSAGTSGNSNQVTGTTTATATCYTATNYAHVTAGRATQSLGYTYANGSNQNMGLYNVFVTTTLRQTGTNYYVIGTCP
jgi:poly(3-hydroxybutyrate) depolymerase